MRRLIFTTDEALILFLINAKENIVKLLSTYEQRVQIAMLNLYCSQRKCVCCCMICNARLQRIPYKYVVGVWKNLESIRDVNANAKANRIFARIPCANRIMFFIYVKKSE